MTAFFNIQNNWKTREYPLGSYEINLENLEPKLQQNQSSIQRKRIHHHEILQLQELKALLPLNLPFLKFRIHRHQV